MENFNSILAVRLTEQKVYHGDTGYLYPSAQIVDSHWAVADREGAVAFTMNYAIAKKRVPDLCWVLLYSETQAGERFYVLAKLVGISMFSDRQVHEIDTRFQTEEWLNEPAKTCLLLSDFEQLDLEAIAPDLCEYLFKQGFRRGYVSAEELESAFVA